MSVNPTTNGWSLEVVRGKDVGRSFALNGGALVLGNALGGEAGIDLSEQEGTAPRRMAAKQAQLECTSGGLTLRDLDSPGGTFVNRQRILPSQARALQPGDVIQLGSVQLKVVSGSAKPAPPVVSRPPESPPKGAGPLAEPFTLATGAVCRSWDDFLTVSAQRWPAMRDELTSGRLAAFLVRIRRLDLVPAPQSPGTPDERLDAWLATIPTTRPSRPELDVHPATLVVRVVPGGGQTRHTVRITNTGYRLLRSTIRIEPAGTAWLEVADEFNRGPLVTIDETDVAIEVEIPSTLDRPLTAALVLDGNGGTRRVDVRLERTAAADMPDHEPSAYVPGLDLHSAIAKRSIPVRIAVGILVGLLLRSLVVAGRVISSSTPLVGAVVVMALAGAAVAAGLAARRGEKRDQFPSGFAGAVFGALAASVMAAASEALEPRVIASNAAVACLFWAALGGGLAAISAWLIPYQKSTEGQP